jgi:small-conductance mechanosensitive channel
VRSLFAGEVNWTTVVLALAGAVALASLAAEIATRTVRRILRSAVGGDAAVLSTANLRVSLRVIRIVVFLLCITVLVIPAFELTGLRSRQGLRLDVLTAWALASGPRILLIIILAYVITRATGLLVRRFEQHVARGDGLDVIERSKRARTLGSVIRRAVAVFIWAIGGLMILRELRMDITPVLTGAGIVGLAVGFGAQTLVKDIISGFFLILENQVRVGDVAVINGTGGLIEAINLRTIVLRDAEGAVHVFPNGSINTLANRSKDFSYYVIDLVISYDEDPDRVVAILREIGAELRRDPAFAAQVLEPIEVFGVDAFGDGQVTIKARIKTVPLKQWEVGRELRRRIRQGFVEHRVQVPPHRFVLMQEREEEQRKEKGKA